MADAMVVARMPQEKKESVAKRLAELGTNASSAINQLYDYIERTGQLPFGNDEELRLPHEERAAAARSWLAGMTRLPEGNRFQESSDGDIREARLVQRRNKWEAAE